MQHKCELAFLIPAVMLLSALFHLGLHFLPPDAMAFRTWEAAAWRSCATPRACSLALGPFQQNETVIKHKAYGDLASIGNLPKFREYRDEILQVDRFGYRNSYLPATEQSFLGIALGDSFVVGADEPESLTLSGRLTEFAGGIFYNAGGSGLIAPEKLGSLATELKMPSGIVVCMLLERALRAPPPKISNEPERLDFVARWKARIKTARLAAEAPLKSVPMIHAALAYRNSLRARPSAKIFSRKAIKLIQNDFLLRNTFAAGVAIRKLQNNDEMLFYPTDLDPLADVNSLSQSWSTYLQWYARELAQRNLKVVVLLVPNKYTVYGPYLDSNQQQGGERLLVAVKEHVEASGMPVIDITPDFRQAAAEGLAQRKYIYWRDDTHWNAAGTAIAARRVWYQIETTPDLAVAIPDNAQRSRSRELLGPQLVTSELH